MCAIDGVLGRWQITLPDGRAGFMQRGFYAQPERRKLRMQDRALLHVDIFKIVLAGAMHGDTLEHFRGGILF